MTHTQRSVFLTAAVTLTGITAVSAYVLLHHPAPDVRFIAAASRQVRQTVRATGLIEPANGVDLSFERSGRVARVAVKVGDTVKAGDVLVELENGSEGSLVAQARALLEQRQAGATPAEIDMARALKDAAKADLDKTTADAAASVAASQAALETAQNNLKLAAGGEGSAIVGQAYETAAVAVQNALSTLDDALTQSDLILGMDNVGANATFQIQLAALDKSKLSSAMGIYQDTKASIAATRKLAAGITAASTHAQIEAAGLSEQVSLQQASKLLSAVADVLTATVSGSALPPADLTAKKAAIQAARKAVDATSAGLIVIKQGAENAKVSLTSFTIAYDKAKQDAMTAQASAAGLVALKQAAYDQAVANLANKTQPVRAVDLAPLRASLSAAAANYGKTVLKAPLDGVITRQDAKAGELVAPNAPLVSVMGGSGYEMKVQVSDTDVAKVTLGDTAQIGLDAYGPDVTFQARVVKVDPVVSLRDGISGYTVTVQLTGDDARIKAGMGGNAVIQVGQKDDVVAVPERSVLQQEGRYYVFLKGPNGRTTQQRVEVGLKDADGWREIVSGLEAGDEVVDFGS